MTEIGTNIENMGHMKNIKVSQKIAFSRKYVLTFFFYFREFVVSQKKFAKIFVCFIKKGWIFSQKPNFANVREILMKLLHFISAYFIWCKMFTGKKTIPHTKMLPQCRNVTKQNCVTLWETDPNGKQVPLSSFPAKFEHS